MSNLFEQVKSLHDNQLYTNLIELASFALTIIEQKSDAVTPVKFQTYVYYANALFNVGQFRKAEVMYSKALQFRKVYFKYMGSNKTSANQKDLTPDIDIKYQLHLCYVKMRQHQEAITILETIPGKQRVPKVHMALGGLYQQGGMERSAISAYKEVIRECPLALEAIEGLLSLSVSGTEVQTIVLECSARKGVNNIDWLMTWIKAHDQINSRDYGNAIKTLKQLDRQSCVRNNHNLLAVLGESYYNAGDTRNAMAVLQRAHLLEPQSGKGLDVLATILAREKRVAEIERLVPPYVPFTEYGTEMWVVLAYCMYLNKKTRKAAYLAQKACLLNPRNVEALLLKATIFLDLKKFQDSIVHFREAMTLAPHRFETHEGLVNCYVGMNRIREALAIASALCKQMGQNSRTLTLYASVLLKDSVSLTKARGLLEKALQHDERYFPAISLLVTVFDQEVNLAGAIAFLQRQVKIQSLCKLHLMLGDLYHKGHQKDKAMEQYMIGLQMEPNNRRLKEAINRLDHNCSKLDSYYMSVNEDDVGNTSYDINDSDNENDGDESEVDAVWSDLDMLMNHL